MYKRFKFLRIIEVHVLKILYKALGIFLITFCLFTGSALAADATDLTFMAHVQNRGWLPSVTNNQITGTVGEGLSLEAFEVNLPDGVDGIRYAAYLANHGWQDWVGNGEIAGTTGSGVPIEAIKIELTGEAAANYDIYYRVHSAYLGWMNWASNGEVSGSTGLALPVQALNILVLPKEVQIGEDTSHPSIDGTNFENADLVYTAHVEYDGWQDKRVDGQTAGTVGEAKGIEAITISSPSIKTLGEDSDITFKTHIENLGWTDLSRNGETSGTTGQSLEMQAMQVNLTGTAAQAKNIYYRVHVSKLGWMDWAKNGETAGTEGLGLPIEAFEIKILPKTVSAPGNTEKPSYNRASFLAEPNLTIQASIENVGWTGPYTFGEVIGTEGLNQGIEALNMNINSADGSAIYYNINIEDLGWQVDQSNGSAIGTEGQNKQAEAIAINLAGPMADKYDIYYQVHSEDYGWLGWTKNGELAGTTGGNKKMEALRVMLVVDGESAPGPTENSYIEIKQKNTASGAFSTYEINNPSDFDLICAIVQHEGGASYESALAVMSCVMNRVDSGRWGGSDPVSVLTAPGQFASYLDGYYRQFLGRTDPSVQQAVLDCLNGVRNHPYQSFRSYRTSGSVCIGGNWYF